LYLSALIELDWFCFAEFVLNVSRASDCGHQARGSGYSDMSARLMWRKR